MEKMEMVKYPVTSINRILQVMDSTMFNVKGIEQIYALNEILQILSNGGVTFSEDLPNNENEQGIETDN